MKQKLETLERKCLFGKALSIGMTLASLVYGSAEYISEGRLDYRVLSGIMLLGLSNAYAAIIYHFNGRDVLKIIGDGEKK